MHEVVSIEIVPFNGDDYEIILRWFGAEANGWRLAGRSETDMFNRVIDAAAIAMAVDAHMGVSVDEFGVIAARVMQWRQRGASVAKAIKAAIRFVETELR